MPHPVMEPENVIVKPVKMIPTSKLKFVAMALMLLLYIYVLLFIKTAYLRSKRLDRITEMVMKTEQKVANVHNMDQNFAMQMSHIDELYEDY